MRNHTEIVPAEAFTGTAQGGDLPKLGDYYWVKPEGKKGKPELMCVAHIASNHVEFEQSRSGWTSCDRVSIYDLMARVTHEPEWRRHIEDGMESLRLQMEAATKLLYDDAVKKGALPSASCETPQDPNCMLPAVRVLDPVKQKRDLVKLQKAIPIAVKKIDELAKEYAAQATALVLPELCRLRAMQKKLRVVEDQIFTLEVYAGLQEEVHKIKDGEPAGVAEPIAIRQAMLYMDEETLFDYDDGGMDFKRVRDFDKWVVKPETLARILPEPRGIVAFRVRRSDKAYECHSVWDAWANMEKNEWNMETYILIRNGGMCYRIASGVNFSPRLIPLRSEFDTAFKQEVSGNWDWETHKQEPSTIRTITPQDFDYDNEAEKLRDNLKHYNRTVVLIQGLLDRSEVFHPHPPVNLSVEASLLEWTRFIRDEEDALEAGGETWQQYVSRLNAELRAGDTVFTGWHRDLRRRPYDAQPMPKTLRVIRVREGRASDTIPESYNSHSRRHDHYGRKLEECIGVTGVEVEWELGTIYSWRQHREVESTRMGRAWIPLKEVFNISGYRLGDYKRFAGDRTQKQDYATWAPALLRAEDHHSSIAKREAAFMDSFRKAKSVAAST